MSLQLQKAILARLDGTETGLTGDQLTAQGVCSPLKWRFGTLTQKGTVPCGTFYEDAGVDAMPNPPDVGLIYHTVWRFEVWTESIAGTFFGTMANALELLFDERKGAPLLVPYGAGKVFAQYLFTPMQAPYWSEDVNAAYGLISFTMLEARP